MIDINPNGFQIIKMFRMYESKPLIFSDFSENRSKAWKILKNSIFTMIVDVSITRSTSNRIFED